MKEKSEGLDIEELKKQKEDADKLILRTEVVLGVCAVVFLSIFCFIDIFTPFVKWLKIVLMVVAFVAFLAVCFICLRLEQKAGYYECAKCHHKYVPTYNQVCCSMHVCRTRYMRCPHCGQKSWQKKVLK